MPAALPPRFVTVDSAKSQGFHDVIGVVVDCLEKTKTSGSSHLVTFTIKDVDFHPGNQVLDGLKIKYFHDDASRLPDLRINDIILLRRLKVQPFRGNFIGVAPNWDNVPWAVFRRSGEYGDSESSGVPVCSHGSDAPTSEEVAYANWLLDQLSRSRSNCSTTPVSSRRVTRSSMISSTAPQQTAVVVSKKRDRFSLIKNITMNTFVDLTVHVVKRWYEDNRVTLYVTDYTVNKSLHKYSDTSDNKSEDDEGTLDDDNFGFRTRDTRENRPWQGPMGQMTLEVTLFEPHSTYAREKVGLDAYVTLTNVHVKTDRLNGKTEGVIHTDKRFPGKLGIRVLEEGHEEDPRFLDLLDRKRDFWNRNKKNKRKLAESLGEDGSGPKKNTKKRRKEQNRLKKQQEQQQKRQQQVRKEEGQTEMPITMVRANRPNPHIEARNPAIKCRSLSDILKNESHNIQLPGGIEYRLPFQNVKYRSIVRVVDFFPPDIIDFAAPYIPQPYSTSSSPPAASVSEDEDDVTPSTYGIKWEWRFCLLVEDMQKSNTPGQPRDRIKLFVSGAEAVFLLRLDATDLRRNRGTLGQLREKLCILWGDLEERKSGQGMFTDAQEQQEQQQPQPQPKSPSLLPFTCCIKEYGVKCACQRINAARLRHSHDGPDSDNNNVGNANNGNNKLGPEHNRECLGWERRFALFGTTIKDP